MAVGCSHGKELDPIAAEAAFNFRDRFKPDIIIHLGDVWDTSAWRAGATGSGDERERTDQDFVAGCRFLDDLGATHLCMGNHDERPYRFLNHSNTLLAEKAEHDVERMESWLKNRKIHYLKSWDIRTRFTFGNWDYTHGTVYGMGSSRKMAFAHAPNSVAFAHTHVASQDKVENIHNPTGMCAGTLSRISHMGYASTRMRTLAWSQAILWGVTNGKETRMWMCENGQNNKRKPWTLPL